MADWKVSVQRNSVGVVESISAYDGIGFTYTITRPGDPNITWNIRLTNGATAFVLEAIAARDREKILKAIHKSEAASIEEEFKKRDV